MVVTVDAAEARKHRPMNRAGAYARMTADGSSESPCTAPSPLLILPESRGTSRTGPS